MGWSGWYAGVMKTEKLNSPPGNATKSTVGQSTGRRLSLEVDHTRLYPLLAAVSRQALIDVNRGGEHAASAREFLLAAGLVDDDGTVPTPVAALALRPHITALAEAV